ncbi:MAG: hypothetical protein QF393_00460, partial [Rhodospirillales bacterium]|nr:hypothetical protein [Rhodospirillales bacterium]
MSLDEVTVKMAAAYVDTVIAPMERAPKTKQGYVTSLNRCWKWHRRRGHLETSSPWVDLGGDLKGPTKEKRPLTFPEI